VEASHGMATEVDWSGWDKQYQSETGSQPPSTSNLQLATCDCRTPLNIGSQLLLRSHRARKKTGANETSYLIAVLEKKCGKWRVDFCFLFEAGLHFRAIHSTPLRLLWTSYTRIPQPDSLENRLRFDQPTCCAYDIVGQYTLTSNRLCIGLLAFLIAPNFNLNFTFFFDTLTWVFAFRTFVCCLCLWELFFSSIFFLVFAIVFHFVSFCFQMQQAATMKTLDRKGFLVAPEEGTQGVIGGW